SIAWLLNVRGSDISHNPVSLAFAILPATGKPELFIDGRKLSNSVRDALSEIADTRQSSELLRALSDLGNRKARVLVDPQSASEAIAGSLRETGATLVEGSDPVSLPRARKNATEIA